MREPRLPIAPEGHKTYLGCHTGIDPVLPLSQSRVQATTLKTPLIGRGDEIRTHDDDFKDRCLSPLGDTPTIKQDSIFWLFFKKRFLMFAVAILNLVVTVRLELTINTV